MSVLEELTRATSFTIVFGTLGNEREGNLPPLKVTGTLTTSAALVEQGAYLCRLRFGEPHTAAMLENPEGVSV